MLFETQRAHHVIRKLKLLQRDHQMYIFLIGISYFNHRLIIPQGSGMINLCFNSYKKLQQYKYL